MTAQGRSRAFINGDLATAGALKELSTRLIELHGQHEHHTLLDPTTHLATLDAFGELDPLLNPVAAAFDVIRTMAEELVRVRQAAADRDARHELLTFQLAELDRAQLTPREDEQLTETRQVLASAERLERLCTESYAALYESDDAVLAHLGGIWRRVAELAALDRAVSALPGSAGTASSRSSRISRCFCAATPMGSTRRPPACRRWKNGWRCSSG